MGVGREPRNGIAVAWARVHEDDPLGQTAPSRTKQRWSTHTQRRMSCNHANGGTSAFCTWLRTCWITLSWVAHGLGRDAAFLQDSKGQKNDPGGVEAGCGLGGRARLDGEGRESSGFGIGCAGDVVLESTEVELAEVLEGEEQKGQSVVRGNGVMHVGQSESE